MNVAPEKKNSIVEYRTAEAFRKGGYSARKEDYDLQSLIILALGEKENAQEEVLGMLDTVFGTIKDRDMVRTLKDDYDIDLAPETIKEADTMCNLSEGFIDRGIEIGLDKGRAEGLAEGENRFGALAIKLKEAGREDDAFKAAADTDFRNELYKEFNL